jgi:hypothetical protein
VVEQLPKKSRDLTQTPVPQKKEKKRRALKKKKNVKFCGES